MRQAQTLNEAQLRRVIKYTRSRRHPVRDETIILTSFYAGLRAKEIAALTVGNVFDEEGNVRTQFILSAAQSKGGQTRTVYLNQRFRKALLEYSACTRITDPQRPLVCEPERRALLSQHNVPTVPGHLQGSGAERCLKPFGKTHLHHAASQQGRRSALACRVGGGIHIYRPRRGISTSILSS